MSFLRVAQRFLHEKQEWLCGVWKFSNDFLSPDLKIYLSNLKIKLLATFQRQSGNKEIESARI